jgi:hypothetical protein
VLENNIDICAMCFEAVPEHNIVCLESAFLGFRGDIQIEVWKCVRV